MTSDYKKYRTIQFKKYLSFESTNLHWKIGQQRFVDIFFNDKDKTTKILDIACGDGVGLRELKKLKFLNVVGVDYSNEKIKIAKKIGYPVYKQDLHDLNKFNNNFFNIIYSSHTFEHSKNPQNVLSEFYRILDDNGLLVIVLPYPDIKIDSQEAHTARKIIGSDKYDDGKQLISYFKKNKFYCIDKFFDTFREPEIWLVFKKSNYIKTNYKPIYQKIKCDEYVKPFYLNDKYTSSSTPINFIKKVFKTE